MFKNFIFLLVFFTFGQGWSASVFAENYRSYNCPVTLKVENKVEDIILDQADGAPKTHSLILKPEEKIVNDEECKTYADAAEFRMNNIEQHDVAFQNLREGDVLTGTLNFHLPSPFGKQLDEKYHNGFRLLGVTKTGDKVVFEDFNDKYIYFRHIGVY